MSLRSLLAVMWIPLLGAGMGVSHAAHVAEAAKDIPVFRRVDVVVVGGSSGAVACACQAARRGASVFLLAPRPYLGTDLCATLRLWLAAGEKPTSKLAAACFGPGKVATPYVVKAAMDRALVEAGVAYLTGCYATDVLRDKDGRAAGVVMANRSGRQAVVAKVVVDASDYAIVARLAGATFRPFRAGPATFRRVVIGGSMQSGADLTGRKMAFTCDSAARGRKRRLPVYQYTLRLSRKDAGLSDWMRVESQARDLTNAAGVELASERLLCIPQDTVVGESRMTAWPGAQAADLAPFRPKGVPDLYVLSGYADIAGAAAEKALRPAAFMAVGERLGRLAAGEARKRPAVMGVHVPAEKTAGGIEATVGESLAGIRSSGNGTIHAGRRRLPILARYDVVVVGGGTSGAPAGMAAAESGAKTLVIEYLRELGGVGTAGLIGSYWRGLRRGYTKYVDDHVNPGKASWHAADKAEWLRRELRRRGAEVWFGVLGCGAVVEGGRVRGVVVASPWGRGVVLAKVVIDATGNADIAACAGAETQYGISRRGSLNVQLAGFPDRPIGNSYVNTCYTMVDDTDVLDVWHLMQWKRLASADKPPAYDVGQLIDSRERRRVVGDYALTTCDILTRRTFPDTISQHYSNFDAAAFPDARLLLLANAKGPNYHTDLPYRCLLPKGLDGILVVGLGASADRDAMTLIRMQPDLQNQGYAAGLAAAAAARNGGHTRKVDIKAIQKTLVEKGCLDSRVLTDRDSYPVSDQAIADAADAVGKTGIGPKTLRPLAVLVAHPRRATVALKARYLRAPAPPVGLWYARVLAILGDPTGAEALARAVRGHKAWDKGVPLTSQRKTGNTYSPLDRLVIALGYSRSDHGRAALLEKLDQLTPSHGLSHYKALALALRQLPPCGADRLRVLLKEPGFTGHASVLSASWGAAGKARSASIPSPPKRMVTRGRDGTDLNKAYKELIVAALLHRCSPDDPAANAVLRQYARDVHGHFARYAQRALAGTLTMEGRGPAERSAADRMPQ